MALIERTRKSIQILIAAGRCPGKTVIASPQGPIATNAALRQAICAGCDSGSVSNGFVGLSRSSNGIERPAAWRLDGTVYRDSAGPRQVISADLGAPGLISTSEAIAMYDVRWAFSRAIRGDRPESDPRIGAQKLPETSLHRRQVAQEFFAGLRRPEVP